VGTFPSFTSFFIAAYEAKSKQIVLSALFLKKLFGFVILEVSALD